jgi:cyclohexanecarboxylate-CoA ligase
VRMATASRELRGPEAVLADSILDDAVYSLIRHRAEATRTATMAIDEHGRTLTFDQYHEQVLAMAAGLLDAGVTPGSRVAWQLVTSLEALVLGGALSRLGVTQVLLLPQYRMRELEHIVGEARPEVVITSRGGGGFDFVAQADEVAAKFEDVRVLCVEDVATSSQTPLPEYAPPGADEPRWIIYTSGTTGSPKGVMHADRTVIAGSRASFVPLEVSAEDRYTLNYPFAHIGGIMTLCTMQSTGCSAVLVARFDPDAHVPLFREHRVTLPGAGPPFFRLYLAVQRKQPGEPILPDARIFPGGGAPKPPTMHDQIKSEIGSAGIFTGYGMSECPMLTSVLLHSPEDKLAQTDGKPVLGTHVRVVDDQGQDTPAGVEGAIRVKGPQLFLGYVDSSLNADAFDEEGYYHTGDLGVFDEDGYLRLTGRLKDVIIRKGENISAKEIEDLLNEHPKIAEVAVIGIPDEERGEMCSAVVVASDPGGPIGLEEIVTYLKAAGLASHKIPERLDLLDELPKNVMGKVQKNKLRARFGVPAQTPEKGAAMATDAERALAMEEIRNLVVQYPHTVDKGDFDGVGEFYDGVTIRAFDRHGNQLGEPHTRSKAEVIKFYEDIIVVDDDGNPNTQHLVSNIQVEVADDAQSATGRSTFTVFNQGEDFPLQCVITGFYEDRYERRDGRWRLVARDEIMGLIGELSHHLKMSLDESAVR